MNGMSLLSSWALRCFNGVYRTWIKIYTRLRLESALLFFGWSYLDDVHLSKMIDFNILKHLLKLNQLLGTIRLYFDIFVSQ